mmetsp:Transcript_81984/g.219345  ORF Transcript_81984/g.219345 Transcript_81984/m.219345 type:complete len:280 (-) Transcript_81984:515-1354(-)
MDPSSSSMCASCPSILCCNSFSLSSVWSISFLQYATFASSSVCSTFRFCTISSISFMTLSKFCFFPDRANAIKSNLGSEWLFITDRRRSRAWCRVARVLVCSCIKDSPEGNVFLNISRASSLFNTLMVSASARSSSARVFLISSYSFALVSQFLASSAEYPSSSSRVLFVSSKSFFNTVMCTASCPARSVFSSIASWAARISLFLAATKPLKFDRASCSLWEISSRRLFISSLMVFKIPTISPLIGVSAEEPDWKKAFTAALSSSMTSTLSSTANTVFA